MQSINIPKPKKPSPQPREVWIVDPKGVQLDSPSRDPKKGRPVLVVTDYKLTRPGAYLFNIIPTTTKGRIGRFRFPIARAYEYSDPWFIPESNSLALIRHFKPIKIDYFIKRCGYLDVTSYETIQNILCFEVIGLPRESYDLAPDDEDNNTSAT